MPPAGAALAVSASTRFAPRACDSGIASPSAISTTAAMRLPHFAGQRPSTHPAIAIIRKHASSSAIWFTPVSAPARGL